MKTVPFFNYTSLYQESPVAFKQIFESVFERGAFIMQDELLEFENNLANFLNCKYVFGVADGTAALIFALKAAGIMPGDEVIISSHTFIATAAAVHHVGAIPVACDCLPDSMISVESVKSLISDKTTAIMPTQLNGRTCNMDELVALASQYNLQIVEDSCQALGASYKGKYAGLFGKVGSYSFYPAKTLGCFGDGGAVATNCDKAASLIKQLRDHGRNDVGLVTMWGHNARLDNFQAAMLNYKLKTYPSALEKRRQIASIYNERLSIVESLILPPPPTSDGVRYDIYQNYEIQAESRDDLRLYLKNHGVSTILQWGGRMIHQFRDLNVKSSAPYAEELSKRFMLLPIHHLLASDDVHYVCDLIVDFYSSTKND